MKNSFTTREMLQLTLLNYILCFVFLTLSEIIFSILYWLVTGKIDVYLFIGIVLYVLGIKTTYSGYIATRNKIKTKEMLDAFLALDEKISC